jgi:hypothetical protein
MFSSVYQNPTSSFERRGIEIQFVVPLVVAVHRVTAESLGINRVFRQESSGEGEGARQVLTLEWCQIYTEMDKIRGAV